MDSTTFWINAYQFAISLSNILFLHSAAVYMYALPPWFLHTRNDNSFEVIDHDTRHCNIDCEVTAVLEARERRFVHPSKMLVK